MDETKRDRKNILLFILRLCFLLRETMNAKNNPDKKYFMDFPSVKAAINNNKPTEVSKLVKNFIEESFSKIEKFGSMFSNINHPKIQSSLMNSIFINHGSIFRGNSYARQLIMIRLIVWSVVSSESFNSITLLLINFWTKKIDVNELDIKEVWLWLHNSTKCILSTTKHVFQRFDPDIESQNPLCQMLLLEASIHHNSLPFRHFGIFLFYNNDTKNSKTNHWSDMTKKFKEYLHLENAPYSAKIDDSKVFTLKSIRDWGNPEIPTNEIAFTMDGFIQKFNQFHLVLVEEMTPLTPLTGVAVHEQMPLVTNREGFIENIKNATDTGTELLLPANMSLATHLTLQKNVESLMKHLEKYNISSLLTKNWELKLQDINEHKKMFPTMKSSFLICCKNFAEKEFPEVDSKVRQYTIKMTNFSALLIFDYIKTFDSKMTLDYKNVLAHVLRHCYLESSSNKNFSWMKFFNMLIPKQAFSKTFSQNLMTLAMFSKKCITTMSIVEPLRTKEEFQFYFQSNYLFDNEKAKIERKAQNKGGKRERDENSFHTESDHTPRRSNRNKSSR